MSKQPKLVNRRAGLDTKLNHLPNRAVHDATRKEYTLDDIRCAGEVVDIDSITPDPMNARLHGERNLDAIKHSLMHYGQKQHLVVREQGRVIAAGNGRWRAAKELGWRKIACHITPMTDEEFIGYSLADNRTSELADWDFQIIKKLERLLEGTSEPMIGWSDDELEVFRMGDWTPPEVTNEKPKEKTTKLTLVLTEESKNILDEVLAFYRLSSPTKEDDTEDIVEVCKQWLELMN